MRDKIRAAFDTDDDGENELTIAGVGPLGVFVALLLALGAIDILWNNGQTIAQIVEVIANSG